MLKLYIIHKINRDYTTYYNIMIIALTPDFNTTNFFKSFYSDLLKYFHLY